MDYGQPVQNLIDYKVMVNCETSFRVRIYNRALSESEIQQLYYQPCQPSIDIILNHNNSVVQKRFAGANRMGGNEGELPPAKKYSHKESNDVS